MLLIAGRCSGQSIEFDQLWQPERPVRLPQIESETDIRQTEVSQDKIQFEPFSNPTSRRDLRFNDIPGTHFLDDTLWQKESELGLTDSIIADHKAFYSRESLSDIAIVLTIGGVMANTNIDRFVTFDLYHENVRNANSDEWLEHLHQPKFFGDAFHAVPVYAGAMLTRKLFSQFESTQKIGNWGDRSIRTLLVGGPPVLVLQQLTGGSRPGEVDHGSHWRPFADDNGVSGHSFVGAVPFLSAAYMTDNGFLRGTLIFASTLPAISRLNDDAHYASQAMMGWSLAFIAANAVNHTELQKGPMRFGVAMMNGSPQLGVTLEW